MTRGGEFPNLHVLCYCTQLALCPLVFNRSQQWGNYLTSTITSHSILWLLGFPQLGMVSLRTALSRRDTYFKFSRMLSSKILMFWQLSQTQIRCGWHWTMEGGLEAHCLLLSYGNQTVTLRCQRPSWSKATWMTLCLSASVDKVHKKGALYDFFLFLFFHRHFLQYLTYSIVCSFNVE